MTKRRTLEGEKLANPSGQNLKQNQGRECATGGGTTVQKQVFIPSAVYTGFHTSPVPAVAVPTFDRQAKKEMRNWKIVLLFRMEKLGLPAPGVAPRQAADIHTGKHTHWHPLGGRDEPIPAVKAAHGFVSRLDRRC